MAADNSQPGKKAKKVGMITAYYAAETFKLHGRKYQKGQLVWDTSDTYNRIVDADETNYLFVMGEGCETDCETILPKVMVNTKTYEMNELTEENAGYNTVFKSEDGLTARLFLADFNGHYCRSYDDHQVLEDVTSRLGEAYVLSFETRVPFTNDLYLFEDFVETENGILRLYINDPSREIEILGYIADLWDTPSGWEPPSAYDKDGLLLTDLWQNLDMPSSASVAYIADLDALYIDGRLYYRTEQ